MVLLISPPKPCFRFEGFAGRHRRAPSAHDLLNIVGVDYAGPSPSLNFFQRCTHKFQPALVEEIDVAVGASAMQHRGSCVDHEPEALFAVPHGILGTLSVLNVRTRTVPSDAASFRVSQRHATHQKPTILPVSPSMTHFLLEGRPI